MPITLGAKSYSNDTQALTSSYSQLLTKTASASSAASSTTTSAGSSALSIDFKSTAQSAQLSSQPKLVVNDIYSAEANFDIKDTAFDEQTKTILTKLREWGEAAGAAPDLERFNNFYLEFKERRLGHNSISLKEKNFKGYVEVKKHLEQIYLALMSNRRIPQPQKLSQYNNLVAQFDVCGPGIVFTLGNIERQLRLKASVTDWLTDARYTTALQIADEITQRDYLPGMSIHVNDACIRYGNSKGLNLQSEEQRSAINDEYKVVLIPAQQSYFDQRFKELYTPASIIERLIIDISNYTYATITEFQQDKLQEKTHPDLCEAIQKAFSLINAQLPVSRLLEFNGEGEFNSDKKVDAEINAKSSGAATTATPLLPPSIIINGREKSAAEKPVVISLRQLRNMQVEVYFMTMMEKTEFHKFIRPYIVHYLVMNGYILATNKHEVVLNNATLHSCDYDPQFSWFEILDKNVYSYADYLKDHESEIPEKIKIKFASHGLIAQLREVQRFRLEYEKSRLFINDWNSPPMLKILKVFLGFVTFTICFRDRPDYNQWCPYLNFYFNQLSRISPTVFLLLFPIVFVGFFVMFYADVYVSILRPVCGLLTWAVDKALPAAIYIRESLPAWLPSPVSYGIRFVASIICFGVALALSPILLIVDAIRNYRDKKDVYEHRLPILAGMDQRVQSLLNLQGEEDESRLQVGLASIVGGLRATVVGIQQNSSSLRSKTDQLLRGELTAIATHIETLTKPTQPVMSLPSLASTTKAPMPSRINATNPSVAVITESSLATLSPPSERGTSTRAENGIELSLMPPFQRGVI